jgi:hypothetical protein
MKRIFSAVFMLLAFSSVVIQAQAPFELIREIKEMTPADYYRLSREAKSESVKSPSARGKIKFGAGKLKIRCCSA